MLVSPAHFAPGFDLLIVKEGTASVFKTSKDVEKSLQKKCKCTRGTPSSTY